MIKIGFFVEGQTEGIFLEKLLLEYLDSAKLVTDIYKLVGKDRTLIKGRKIGLETRYYFLIYEVGGNGETVVSALLENSENMIIQKGYNHLICLRDLYPRLASDKKKVIEETNRQIRGYRYCDKIKHVLAIMEIEAWFLAEYGAFSKIDRRLTTRNIESKLGIDLENDDPESYSHPSRYIDRILKMIGKRYSKKEKHVYSMVYRINFKRLCSLTNKISSFFYFLKCINESIQPF